MKKIDMTPPPVSRPEWAPISGRRGWWLHRDGVRKTYAPDGSIPDPDEPPPPVPDVSTETDITLTTGDGQEIIFIKGLKVRNKGTP